MVRRGCAPRGFQDAHHLEHDRDTVGVVSRAEPGMPGVDVRADHHHLIPELGIGAGDLTHDVVGIGVAIEEVRLHVDPQLHWHVVLQ